MARAKVHIHDVIHGVAVIVTGRIGGGKEIQIAADGQKWPPPRVADDGEEDEQQQQQPGHFFWFHRGGKNFENKEKKKSTINPLPPTKDKAKVPVSAPFQRDNLALSIKRTNKTIDAGKHHRYKCSGP
jgi:hypothetical protein